MHPTSHHWLFATLCFTRCAAPAVAQLDSSGGMKGEVGRYSMHVDGNAAVLPSKGY